VKKKSAPVIGALFNNISENNIEQSLHPGVQLNTLRHFLNINDLAGVFILKNLVIQLIAKNARFLYH